MKKSKKIALIVLASISAFLLCGFVALFFCAPLIGGDPDAAWASVLESLKLVEELFLLPFGAISPAASGLVAGFGSYDTALALGISALVLTGLVFATLVLGIVLACVRKKPVMIAYTPVLLLAWAAGVVMLGCGALYFATIQLAMILVPPQTGAAILYILLVAFACLGFILAYITYVLGLVWTKGNKAAEAAEEEAPEEIAPVAEEVKDPEMVEEAESIVFPLPVIDSPSVEPEPAEEATSEEPEPVPVEEPVEEKKPEPEPAPEASSHVEVNVNNPAPAPSNGLDANSLASLLREVVRDIVRDEIARNNANQPQPAQPAPNGNQTITGATFGGPLVVQYFNGGINGVTPAPAPAPAPVPAPATVEEKKPEPQPEPAPAPVEEAKPEPVAEPVPAPVVVEEKKEEPAPLFTKKEVPAGQPEAPKYERISFAERLLKSDKELQALYSELKNEILSYGVKSRISAVGDTFRLHKKMYVRITVAGKSLKLYFALNPADYANTTLPIQDASNKEMYVDIPLVFKVKSGLSVRRCKELIQDVMEKDGLEQGEIGKVNWIKELKAEMNSAKKKEKEE